MNINPLFIRADANTHMGTGHVMRCLALGQAWQNYGGQVTFITACIHDGLAQRLRDEGFTVEKLAQSHPNPTDWEFTATLLARYPQSWVVLDGYHFEPDYQYLIKTAGHPLLIIDDTAHLPYYHADILLNQNINAEQLTYRCDPNTHLLLGTRYALLRREFWPWREGKKREIPKIPPQILVTLGGGDPDNQTLKVIRALQQIGADALEVVVAIGASNLHRAALENAIANSSLNIRLLQNATNMPELMARADMAVSAGGSTCWELAFMGLPAVILVIADNQREIATGLDNVGAAFNLGWFENVREEDIAETLTALLSSLDTWQEMSRQGRKLVDGRGSERVIQELNILM